MGRFTITTAIVYTNAPPHIGFALELVQADAIARWRRQRGDDVYFLTGTDEHGTKIARSAEKAHQQPQEFVDDIARQVVRLGEDFEISNDDFIRTTDQERHWPAAQKLWNKLAEQGDLYAKTYEGHYCVGHEAFVKTSELIEGRCPIHKTEPERIQEQNWFFRLSRYRDRIADAITSDRLRIVPASRRQEVLNLLKDAEDVSFSRPSEQLSWGIPVPNDPSQTMYVWADALTNYISALGYAEETERFRSLWPADVHLIGKDILRFHAMIWPAMLLSAGLELPRAIYVHGFINVDGEKMSKSLGNVVEPLRLLEEWGADVARYYLLRAIPSTEDGDFSWDNLRERYDGELANGLGNLVQRTVAMLTKLGGEITYDRERYGAPDTAFMDTTTYDAAMEQFRLHDALADVWKKIGEANAFINLKEPWRLDGDELEGTLLTLVGMVAHIAWLLQPFMPGTAQTIAKRLGVPLAPAIEPGTVLKPRRGNPLFPRR
jgi:methionyl-tRNA synthetase